MTTKSDFTEEEWARVRRAPFVAGLAISIADSWRSHRASQRVHGARSSQVTNPTPAESNYLQRSPWTSSR